MELFKSFISAMAFLSLGFSAAAAYLKINKVWKRKHNEEVANSVSIVGNVVDLVPLTFFALNYLLVMQWQGFIDSVIWIVAGVVSVLIGAGLWVPGNRRKSFWAEVRDALRLEKSEIGHLAKSLFRPSNAEAIVEILAHFAFLDRKLEPREKSFIENFAESWHVDLDWSEHRELADKERPATLLGTRGLVVRYLDTSPPREQAAELIDVLTSLVKVDEEVTLNESMMLQEATGLLSAYVNEVDEAETFTVIIAPQQQDHDTAVASLLPNARRVPIAGGSGYVVGTYFSRSFAQMVCRQYRGLGFFTVDVAEGAAATA